MRKHRPCHARKYDHTARCGVSVGFNQGCFAGREQDIDCPACLDLVIHDAEWNHEKRMRQLRSQGVPWEQDDDSDEDG